MAGKLIFYYGTVCSGKTLTLLNIQFNYNKCGWKVVTIKPALDTRSKLIETRADVPPSKADIVLGKDDSLFEYNELINSADVILVDECQFLTTKQVEELRYITINKDIDVLCFGLRTDFNANLFEASSRLFALADEINEIKTICNVCGKHAGFNSKLESSNDDGQGNIIPSWDLFEQRCYKHFCTCE